jgi:hypothetical protein
MSPLDAANDAIRRNMSVGDYIMLSHATVTKTIIGEVVSTLHSEVRYCELVPMAIDTMERVLFQLSMQALYQLSLLHQVPYMMPQKSNE